MEDTTTYQHRYSINPKNWRLLRSQLANDVAMLPLLVRMIRQILLMRSPHRKVIISHDPLGRPVGRHILGGIPQTQPCTTSD